ncbi:hypothetical protein [Nitratireductor indicus]|uniref:hypothetical protein n=1 Tax=Nitratireductor indicus TaxID=721133 RepID=UPI002873F59E|nr:hypothetical protein [Nitratireductor indicus]MDS1138613.1 hypothetical protein [Nitratireductor indicus]
MTVIALDRQFLTDYLNALPPHSRKRVGVVDLLRRVKTMELAEERKVNQDPISVYLVNALDSELSAFSEEERQRLREVW